MKRKKLEISTNNRQKGKFLFFFSELVLSFYLVVWVFLPKLELITELEPGVSARVCYSGCHSYIAFGHFKVAPCGSETDDKLLRVIQFINNPRVINIQ